MPRESSHLGTQYPQDDRFERTAGRETGSQRITTSTPLSSGRIIGAAKEQLPVQKPARKGTSGWNLFCLGRRVTRLASYHQRQAPTGKLYC